MPHNPLPIALVGPTGAGKTALGIELAQRLDAEIVNCDSRQVYRGLDIGTAKPSAAERAAVPHHLFDVVDPDDPLDCVRYRDRARAVIAEIQARSRRPILVGGSGLYLKVLRYGIAPAPARDAALRARLAAEESAAPGTLHARLRDLDPPAAARLHPADRVRVIRAIEVAELTGTRLSARQAAHGFRRAELDCRLIGIDVERDALYGRLDARCQRMIADGLVDEVRGLWERGFGPDLVPLRSIGYREIGAYLLGRCELETALAAMQRATRRFAKRQLTWWRADATVTWIDTAEPARIIEAVSGANG